MNGELTVAADLVDSVIAAAENPTILDAGCGSGEWYGWILDHDCW